MSELKSLLDALAARTYERAVMITLVRLDGTGYRKPGARMIITDDAWSAGTVSGGCVEGMLREHAQRVMHKRAAELIEIDTTSGEDVLFGSGLGCPGRLQFRLEPLSAEDVEYRYGEIRERLAARRMVVVEGEAIEPPIALHVFGAGNDAIPLAALAAAMHWETTVYDGRAALLQPERFASGTKLEHVFPRELSLDHLSAAVLTTHNYFVDLDWLRHILRTPARYVAVIGSSNRMEMLRGVLAAEGLDVSRVRGPAGLDIGSETPAEIALSVLAEIKAVLSERNGAPLSSPPNVSVHA